MDEHVTTAIGRVVPTYEGTWNSERVYNKLDNVLYDGSTYVAVQYVPAGNQPSPDSNYWQLLARKGDVGSIRNVYASAELSEQPTASAKIIGEDPSSMDLEFTFGLPKGDTGDPAAITQVTATAEPIGYDEDPWVTAEIDGNPDDATLAFQFHIPVGGGTVSQVDGVNPRASNVPLQAVSFGVDQTDSSLPRYITPEQAEVARNNIRAVSREIKINDHPLTTNFNLTAGEVGAYAIPDGGIPKDDLAQGVKTSLGKADTAYQVPSGGIPKAHLTQGVQASLGKADSAYQMPLTKIPKTDLASDVIPTAYTGTPKKDETTAKPGSSPQWARGDHVHPTDDSRQQKITVTGILKGGGGGAINTASPGADYITPATNYSKIKTIAANYSISKDDIGKTLVATAKNITITVPTATESSLPLGGEIGIVSTNLEAKFTISVPSGNGRVCVGGTVKSFKTVKCSAGYSMLAIKVFEGPRIALFGDVEVTS